MGIRSKRPPVGNRLPVRVWLPYVPIAAKSEHVATALATERLTFIIKHRIAAYLSVCHNLFPLLFSRLLPRHGARDRLLYLRTTAFHPPNFFRDARLAGGGHADAHAVLGF
jgi:hypothetical protein